MILMCTLESRGMPKVMFSLSFTVVLEERDALHPGSSMDLGDNVFWELPMALIAEDIVFPMFTYFQLLFCDGPL